ncbi:adp-ribosylation factor f-related [Anaeramoeba flamelloides]|uniref:Adp-ribosylation factor f-related n=1 Tax=Anaeramoeba flamelloides TaxID=1746091 RepID=A0AAV7Z764_9EUKA|nr:adp-ribosylation factor f-related [Anaeramoeba flamelloides]
MNQVYVCGTNQNNQLLNSDPRLQTQKTPLDITEILAPFLKDTKIEHVVCGSTQTIFSTKSGVVILWGLFSNQMKEYLNEEELKKKVPNTKKKLLKTSRKNLKILKKFQGKKINQICCSNFCSLFLVQGQLFQIDFSHFQNTDLFVNSITTNSLRKRVQQIGAGQSWYLLVDHNQRLWYWGSSRYLDPKRKPKKKNKNESKKQNIKIVNYKSPQKFKSVWDLKINEISCGGDHFLFLDEEQDLYGCGQAQFGQLGNNQLQDQLYPIKLYSKDELCQLGINEILQINCSEQTSAILDNFGSVFISGQIPHHISHNSNENPIIPIFTKINSANLNIGKISNIILGSGLGKNFLFLINEKKNIFSIADDNEYGNLGVGNIVQNEKEEEITIEKEKENEKENENENEKEKQIIKFKTYKIQFPKKFSIEKISCGWTHSIFIGKKLKNLQKSKKKKKDKKKKPLIDDQLGNFSYLTPELIFPIMFYLSKKDLCKLSLTSTLMNHYASNDWIWSQFFQKKFKEPPLKDILKIIEYPYFYNCGWKQAYAATIEDSSQERSNRRYVKTKPKKKNWDQVFINPFNRYPSKKEVQTLWLGLDRVGKSTIIYKFKINEEISISPTWGFIVENYKYSNYSFVFWECGGLQRIRPLWPHYYDNKQYLIWVIRQDERGRLKENKIALHNVFKDVRMKNLPLLVYVNKFNSGEEQMTTKEIIKGLELEKLEQNWHVQPCSQVTKEGLFEGLDWIVSQLNYEYIKVEKKLSSESESESDSDLDSDTESSNSNSELLLKKNDDKTNSNEKKN